MHLSNIIFNTVVPRHVKNDIRSVTYHMHPEEPRCHGNKFIYIYDNK